MIEAVEKDLEALAPEWVAYAREQGDAVNRGEETIYSAYQNMVRFALKGIADLLAQAAVLRIAGPADYRTRRSIVRVLGHRIRQLRREEGEDV